MSVADFIEDKGITRLCHFTPFRNLVHLSEHDEGLMSLNRLAELGANYSRQDPVRADHHLGHVSASIEYPNAWYLAAKRMDPIGQLFPDWVCLAIEPSHLDRPETRVCVRNASYQSGGLIEDVSEDALNRLYGPPAAGSRATPRSGNRLAACPTDDQAEILIASSVPLADIQRIIVASEAQAVMMTEALKQTGSDIDKHWYVAPTLFDKYGLSNSIRDGIVPAETLWDTDPR